MRTPQFLQPLVQKIFGKPNYQIEIGSFHPHEDGMFLMSDWSVDATGDWRGCPQGIGVDFRKDGSVVMAGCVTIPANYVPRIETKEYVKSIENKTMGTFKLGVNE